MWEEQAVIPVRKEGSNAAGTEEFDVQKMFEEIKFLSWSQEDNKFVNTEKAIIDELQIYNEFKNLIISGKYMEAIMEAKEKMDNKSKECEELQPTHEVSNADNLRSKFTNANEKNKVANEQLLQNVDEPDIILEPITSHEHLMYDKESNLAMEESTHKFVAPVNVTTTASDKTLSSAFVEDDDLLMPSPSSHNTEMAHGLIAGVGHGRNDVLPPHSTSSAPSASATEEDNVIQHLLEDIRGSFERQFDDEFDFDHR